VLPFAPQKRSLFLPYAKPRSSSTNSSLGAEGFGTDTVSQVRGAARKHVLVQEGSYSLYRLDAGSNLAHRPMSNKLR